MERMARLPAPATSFDIQWLFFTNALKPSQLPSSAAGMPPSPISDPPTASDPHTPSCPMNTCHHPLIACPRPDLLSIRHNIFRSWADLILSFLPSDFVPAHMDLDPDS